jgi:hypothetical protein
MLFHIEQVHTPENCPYGRGGSRSFQDASVTDVKVIAIYGAFMEHRVFLVVEASEIEALNRFLLPGMKACTTNITPVSDHPMPIVAA